MSVRCILQGQKNNDVDLENYYTKEETLTSETAALYGLGEEATPDDVLKAVEGSNGLVRNGNGELKAFYPLGRYLITTGSSAESDSSIQTSAITPNLKWHFSESRTSSSSPYYLRACRLDKSTLDSITYTQGSYSDSGYSNLVCDDDTVISLHSNSDYTVTATIWKIIDNKLEYIEKLSISTQSRAQFVTLAPSDFQKVHNSKVLMFVIRENSTSYPIIICSYNKETHTISTYWKASSWNNTSNGNLWYYPLGDKILFAEREYLNNTPANFGASKIHLINSNGEIEKTIDCGYTANSAAVDFEGKRLFVKYAYSYSDATTGVYHFKILDLETLEEISDVALPSNIGGLWYLNGLLHNSNGEILNLETGIWSSSPSSLVRVSNVWKFGATGFYPTDYTTSVPDNEFVSNTYGNSYGRSNKVWKGTKTEFGVIEE